jgi:phage FluMu protein Com
VRKLERAPVGRRRADRPLADCRQAVNGGYSWLKIECSRCKTRRNVELAELSHPPTTFVHDLAGRLRCSKCAKANRRPSATLLQLAQRGRHPDPGT